MFIFLSSFKKVFKEEIQDYFCLILLLRSTQRKLQGLWTLYFTWEGKNKQNPQIPKTVWEKLVVKKLPIKWLETKERKTILSIWVKADQLIVLHAN